MVPVQLLFSKFPQIITVEIDIIGRTVKTRTAGGRKFIVDGTETEGHSSYQQARVSQRETLDRQGCILRRYRSTHH
jgi:hypothetical protein